MNLSNRMAKFNGRMEAVNDRVEDINWPLVNRLHERVAKPKVSNFERLMNRLQGMSDTSRIGQSIEFYMVQYCMIAECSLSKMWNDAVKHGYDLNPAKGREAYELLKDLSWLTCFDSFKYRLPYG